jgi:hypothetical protein
MLSILQQNNRTGKIDARIFAQPALFGLVAMINISREPGISTNRRLA